MDPFSPFMNGKIKIEIILHQETLRSLEFINRLFAASNKNYDRTWHSDKERKILKNWFLNKLSMIAKQRVIIDLNKNISCFTMR